MTMLNITQANRGTEVYGVKTGDTVFTDHESRCFFFATAPNGRSIKISKQTLRACGWSSQATSPVFSVVEFEPVDDPDAWKAEDDQRLASRK